MRGSEIILHGRYHTKGISYEHTAHTAEVHFSHYLLLLFSQAHSLSPTPTLSAHTHTHSHTHSHTHTFCDYHLSLQAALRNEGPIRGLRVRMGIATGVLPEYVLPANSDVLEMARLVSDAAAGGQVRM